jgi:hypothetical protein
VQGPDQQRQARGMVQHRSGRAQVRGEPFAGFHVAPPVDIGVASGVGIDVALLVAAWIRRRLAAPSVTAAFAFAAAAAASTAPHGLRRHRPVGVWLRRRGRYWRRSRIVDTSSISISSISISSISSRCPFSDLAAMGHRGAVAPAHADASALPSSHRVRRRHRPPPPHCLILMAFSFCGQIRGQNIEVRVRGDPRGSVPPFFAGGARALGRGALVSLPRSFPTPRSVRRTRPDASDRHQWAGF